MPRKQKSLGTPTPWDETAETVVTGTGAAETGFAWGLPVGIAAACVAAGGAVLYIRRKRGKKTVRRKRKSFLVSLLLILVLVFSGLPDRSRTGGSDGVGKPGAGRDH